MPNCATPYRCEREHQRSADALEYLLKLGRDEQAQDVAEYALLLAVVLIIAVTTLIALGTHANAIFSKAASAL